MPPVDTYLKKLLSVCHKCGISFEGYKGVLNHWNNDHREEQPKFQCKFSICEYVANKGDQVRIRNQYTLLFLPLINFSSKLTLTTIFSTPVDTVSVRFVEKFLTRQNSRHT